MFVVLLTIHSPPPANKVRMRRRSKDVVCYGPFASVDTAYRWAESSSVPNTLSYEITTLHKPSKWWRPKRTG